MSNTRRSPSRSAGRPAALWQLLGLALLLQPAPLGAQVSESLAGRVLDASTGSPVSGAQVELQGVDGARVDGGVLRALTGSRGEFEVSSVSEGTYLLQIRHLAYGTHHHPLQVQGGGSGAIEILLSPTAIRLAPLLVDAEASRELEERASPASRNILTRERIEPAAASGVHLGDFLRREVSGIFVRQGSGVGGDVCVEFRGARRADGLCRPPQVYLDGATVPDPLNFFGYFDLDSLERIQVIPPSEAGAALGPDGGWGVILLETARGSARPDPGIPVAVRRYAPEPSFDWSLEQGSHPSGAVYGSAFLGNAAGLFAGMALLDHCMDLGTRRIYRGADHCGLAPLIGAGVAAAVLPALGGSLAARFAGATDRSRGRLRQSILYSAPVFIPGFALLSMDAGSSGLSGLDVAGLVMVVVGAPALNTLADRRRRELR